MSLAEATSRAAPTAAAPMPGAAAKPSLAGHELSALVATSPSHVAGQASTSSRRAESSMGSVDGCSANASTSPSASSGSTSYSLTSAAATPARSCDGRSVQIRVPTSSSPK